MIKLAEQKDRAGAARTVKESHESRGPMLNGSPALINTRVAPAQAIMATRQKGRTKGKSRTTNERDQNGANYISEQSPLEIASNYLKRRWEPVVIGYLGKVPEDAKWAEKQITAENVAQYFNGSKQNIGVRLGSRSNNLGDVDLDCSEAIALASTFLPPTNAVFGRASKPGSHQLYTLTDTPEARAAIQLKDEQNKVIVELRLGGGDKAAQTVFPGSTHESGETIAWVRDGAPAKVTTAELERAIAKIAAGTLIARQWPEQSRHEAALRVGGFLTRAGWEAEEIGEFMEAVQQAAGVRNPEHIKNGVSAATSAVAAAADGKHVYGLRGLIEFFGEAVAKQIAKVIAYHGDEPPWRERDKNGRPKASFHNARLAILDAGVRCSHDTFHHELLFGYDGDEKHAVEFMIGEVTDDGITALRTVLSNRFGFDLGERNIRDAVISLANENRVDPIADMLAKAEAEWDGVKRLDRMAVDYFNCEDTPFARAAVRKSMIAGVARVRNPGCKFDTMPVLEGEEGIDKSTAVKTLARGDKNFSDEPIIGKPSREVQEQLSGIWIHENAELGGMKKAEVEMVKAFASRMEDRARPAYGHFLKTQKRHSIEWGTTNGNEYLQSQTGNRRFWPLLVRSPVDIAKLERDVLQLWGEAAHYQTKGESLVLDKALWPDAAIEQEKRRVKDPWEDVLAIELKLPEGQKETGIIHRTRDMDYVSSRSMLQTVLDIPVGQQTNADMQRLANAMKAIGWQRSSNGKVWIDGEQVRGYLRPRKPGVSSSGNRVLPPRQRSPKREPTATPRQQRQKPRQTPPVAVGRKSRKRSPAR